MCVVRICALHVCLFALLYECACTTSRIHRFAVYARCIAKSVDLFNEGVVEGLELGLVRMLHLLSHRHIWLHLSNTCELVASATTQHQPKPRILIPNLTRVHTDHQRAEPAEVHTTKGAQNLNSKP